MLWRLEMALWAKNADSRHASKNQDKISGDAEFKQNKTLPAEKQIVTANPEINAEHLYCTLIAENFATALPQILVVQGFSLLLVWSGKDVNDKVKWLS
ncbi:uncharacterized protein LOC108484356 isoform X2 [Gossypium arboreum]|uniref:Uncharacterized protein n=1 Tax=Gossypium arboreum TaxID=29729 RepID=A0ABR0PNU9_GOSAR|nr:uncharacterized protein LOC108484356 isoform X2 [Gossypium arboreum]XP_052886070.1 uncharacterized protein LOC108484356 isoform X2 [Gossypium arboreum]XP_052886071.1 uncharacterized protein LOC108484356 isoform X2 [Gossypium arboreum]KAK5825951.1 hypothetical protein PVK06_020842 [Gossypium arboreum]